MEKRLSIKAPDGLELAGVLHVPERESSDCVVICHGMMSYKDSPKHVGIARGICEMGHAAVRFDFSGRGDSQGDLMGLSFTRQVGECRAVMAVLRDLGYSRFGLVGSSMGGAVAILTAAEERVAVLATMASVGRADLLPERAVGKGGLADWERQGHILLQGETVGWALVEDSRETDVLAAAARIFCPWLILHGEKDEVIPASDANLLDAAGSRAVLEIVPDADHKFSMERHRELITGRIIGFIHASLSEI
jgi:alpha-beta hydrolase superfamily lysophospholipase